MIKIVVLYMIRFILSILKILPLKKNSIFFLSYQGKQYSCNPRAIYEYMNSHFSGLEFIWGIYDSTKVINCSSVNALKCAKPKTFAYFKRLVTAKYVITNIQLPVYIPKKHDSIWINTWHGGGAFKKVEYPATNLYSKIARNIQMKHTDCYISSSRKFTEVMSKSTGFQESTFIEIGMPRNDVFFSSAEEKNRIREKVVSLYNIPRSSFIVLFAPTYRGKSARYPQKCAFKLDTDKVKTAFKNRFGKDVVIIVRSHHAAKDALESVDGIIDGTSYPDMQDLLVACDSLITDYSSCIYDFSLSGKPGFLFVPDIVEYEYSRGLYTPVSEWAFDYAATNDGLCRLIENYDDEKAAYKRNAYLERLGSCDKGTALQAVADILMKENV